VDYLTAQVTLMQGAIQAGHDGAPPVERGSVGKQPISCAGAGCGQVTFDRRQRGEAIKANERGFDNRPVTSPRNGLADGRAPDHGRATASTSASRASAGK